VPATSAAKQRKGARALRRCHPRGQDQDDTTDPEAEPDPLSGEDLFTEQLRCQASGQHRLQAHDHCCHARRQAVIDCEKDAAQVAGV